MSFDLVLFDSQEELDQRAADFFRKYQEELAEIKKDPRGRVFIETDLTYLRSWNMLEYFDGTRKNGRGYAHQRTRENFFGEHGFIQDAFTLAVNAALLLGETPGAPGYSNGHQILFREVASDPKSLFYDAITPELQIRLNNGRFYELLPYINGSIMGDFIGPLEDVLVNHYKDLSVDFAQEKGFDIFLRGCGKHDRRAPRLIGFFHGGPETIGISERAIEQYGLFVEKLRNSGVEGEVFNLMTKGLINTLDLRDFGHPVITNKKLENTGVVQDFRLKQEFYAQN